MFDALLGRQHIVDLEIEADEFAVIFKSTYVLQPLQAQIISVPKFARFKTGGSAVAEQFDNIIQEYIDFLNQQVGVYMDAMAGFAHIKVKVERQVQRVNRLSQNTFNEKGERVMVYSSYEDPTKPDIVHNRIMPADEYLAANAPGGSNEQQHSQAILVFLVAYWEYEIRPRLAKAKAVEHNSITSNIMGDLTIARNAILHAKGCISRKEYKRIKALSDILKPEEEIFVHYNEMHKVFYMIKQDMARLMLDWLGVTDNPVDLNDIRDFAIQRRRTED